MTLRRKCVTSCLRGPRAPLEAAFELRRVDAPATQALRAALQLDDAHELQRLLDALPLDLPRGRVQPFARGPGTSSPLAL